MKVTQIKLRPYWNDMRWAVASWSETVHFWGWGRVGMGSAG